MRKRWMVAAAVAVVAVLLVDVGTSSAQLFRRGGRSRGYYGGSYGYGGNYGGYGYGYGPMYGGTGYAPGYISGYAPTYGYAAPILQPGYPLAGNALAGNTIVGNGLTPLQAGTTSFYYQPGMTGVGLNTALDSRTALVEVRVPPDAQVWFDGDSTTQRGPDRLFTTPQLDPGQTYRYQVKARWTQNGRPVERTQTVRIRPGQRALVDFNQSTPDTGDLE